MITVTTTQTGTKQSITAHEGQALTMYVCGVTPYDHAHLGHGRVYVSFDVLYRLLQYCGYEVRYCRNFTDIDDKLIAKAIVEYGDGAQYYQIAERYMASFHEDMAALYCLPPAYEPRVTETISDIIVFVQGLIDAGHAYVLDHDVYFDIQSFSTYGQLSKHHLEDLQAGARVEVNEKKRHPLDFALWKGEKESTFWRSPWGWGRPGWHIECSAMAQKFLGDHIDIHAGGLDLVFPHHENEKAQSEALLGAPFVRYWMHNGFVRIHEEKMSKSLGNFFTLKQVFERFHPMIVRFYLLSHHYRMPLEFSFDALQVAETAYRKLCRALLGALPENAQAGKTLEKDAVVGDMLSFLQDDLNTPGMFGVLFKALHEVSNDKARARAVKAFLHDVLGLTLELLPEPEVVITPEIQRLIEERETARQQRNWQRADEIRDQLIAYGVRIADKKNK